MAFDGRLSRDLTHDRLKAVLRALLRVDRDTHRTRLPRNGRNGDTNGKAERTEAEKIATVQAGEQPPVKR